MSEKSTKFDEFASLFRSVVKPHLEVAPLPLTRLLVVLDCHGDDRRRAASSRVAEAMTDTFKTETRLLYPVERESETSDAQAECEQLLGAIQKKGGQASGKTQVGFPATQILDEIDAFDPDMIVLPNLFGESDPGLEGFSLGGVVDKVLSSTGKPILLIEGEIPDPALLWSDILIFVEQSTTAERCLAATRTLACKEAQARLLHVINADMLRMVDHAFGQATQLETKVAADALCEALRKDMDHYLMGAKELLDRTGHRASYQVEIGDPIEIVRAKIQEHSPHLVVCNSVAPDQRLVDSIAYNLAAYLHQMPVLLV